MFSIATQKHTQWIYQPWNYKVIISLVFSLILFLVLDFSLAIPSKSAEEALALVKWKASLEVHGHSLLHSWSLSSVNATKISPCAWLGIHCNHARRVIGINPTSISLNNTPFFNSHSHYFLILCIVSNIIMSSLISSLYKSATAPS